MTKIRLGVVGAGHFLSTSFLSTFLSHPGVGDVLVTDLKLDRAEELVRKHKLAGAFDSLGSMLRAGVDAVAIFTPRQTHAALAAEAMESGAHAYMAVPAAVTLDELRTLTETSARTRRVCATGETSYYYPEIVYCREEFATGRWGRFVHAEAQYIHDWATWGPHFRLTFGEDWRRYAAIPPMHYATHSFSMPLSVTGAHVTHVSAQGFVDTDPDGGYGKGSNPWDNPFSNTVALGRTSDGGSIRIGEFRRLGWFAERSGREVMMPSFYCTDAAFEENMVSDYALTGEASRRAVERGLAAAEWYHTEVPRKVMKELMQRRTARRSATRSIWAALHVLFAAGGIYFWGTWWACPSGWPMGCSTARPATRAGTNAARHGLPHRLDERRGLPHRRASR
jgi:predicted dehydrogenase